MDDFLRFFSLFHSELDRRLLFSAKSAEEEDNDIVLAARKKEVEPEPLDAPPIFAEVW